MIIGQVPGRSMCNDCLAVRSTYWCALNFPRCIDTQHTIAICADLCQSVNDRCSTTLACGGLPTSLCSSAIRVGTNLGTLILQFLVTVIIILFIS